MADLPDTRPSLLVRLKNAGDGEAWRQFVALYAPVLYGYARKKGLQDADAADVAQEVLRAVNVATERQRYDPARGPFRRWLFAIAYRKLADALARQAERGSGDTAALERLNEQPAPADADEWDHEYRARLFAWAAEQVRSEFHESTWQAFWLTAVEGKGGKEAADALGLSVAAVYVAKSRVMARLKERIREASEED